MTTQIQEWTDSFGDDYTRRNAATDEEVNKREYMWREILKKVDEPLSALEVGANVGANLRALRRIIGNNLLAVEPNDYARIILAQDGFRCENSTADHLPYPDNVADLVFTCGVLIHVPPEKLLASMREIYRCAKRYVCAVEYFSDKPQMVVYRGKADLLFKRDFGAMYLDHFPDLLLRDCGFFWKRSTGLDNLTYWLFEKL